MYEPRSKYWDDDDEGWVPAVSMSLFDLLEGLLLTIVAMILIPIIECGFLIWIIYDELLKPKSSPKPLNEDTKSQSARPIYFIIVSMVALILVAWVLVQCGPSRAASLPTPAATATATATRTRVSTLRPTMAPSRTPTGAQTTLGPYTVTSGPTAAPTQAPVTVPPPTSPPPAATDVPLTPTPVGGARSLTIQVDDFAPQPQQGQTVYFYNRLDGDRGAVNNSDLDWGRGEVTATLSAGNTWGGGWMSLNHPIREGLPISFSAILPAQILPAYQSQITGVTARIARGTPGKTFRLELKDHGALRWAGEATLSGGRQAAAFELPVLGEANELLWVLDHAAPGDSVVLGSIAFTATTRITDTATAAFVWSYGMLLNNWNPATGLVRDKAKDASGEFDAIQATGSLAAATAVAEQLGVISRGDATAIVNKIGEALLDLPRLHGLWPHWTGTSPEGRPGIVWGTEWSSVDTAIAAIGLLTAQQALGLDTSRTEAMLAGIEWADIVRPAGIGHGYTYDGPSIPYAWDVFGGESWLVELAYASATGRVAAMAYPSPPTANGAGFIDEMAFLWAPPPSGPDRWGNDWQAHRTASAEKQIAYFRTHYPASCLASLGLLGLSAAEVPDPAQVSPADIYQAFGVGGRFAAANDGSAVMGVPVVVPHDAGMLASLQPDAGIRMWDWLIENGYFSPLTNVESLAFAENSTCDSAGVVWNELKGSWNLALQTLAWGRYLAERRGLVPSLWQATTANSFLRNGYLLLAPGRVSP